MMSKGNSQSLFVFIKFSNLLFVIGHIKYETNNSFCNKFIVDANFYSVEFYNFLVI